MPKQGGREGRIREPIVVSREDDELLEDMSDLIEDGETSRENGMAEPITQWPSEIGM